MEDKECCSWDGVECDKTTGHVIGLDLGCSWLFGPIHSNSSLFFLRHLRRLNLAGNDFNHSLLPSEFGKFKSLTHLNLSYSGFSGQIPYEISQLSSLVSLDLAFNWQLIEMPVWKRVVDNLTQLRELVLDYTNMYSIRPYSLMNLSSYLTTLSLIGCSLQGKLEDNILCLPSVLSSSLLNMPMLSELHLEHNQLVGPLPNSVSGLLNLTLLYLNSNFLNGTLPSWLFSLPSLVTLLLVDNQLSGEIGEFKSNSLEYLDLSGNMLHGSIPSLHGTIPARFAKGNNLRNLNLNGNQLEGPLPRSLVNCSDLQVLDLGNNRINGTFPYWLGSLPNLHVLVLRSNRFHGPIGNPKTKFPFPNLRILDLSTNMFSGPLPGKYFKYLKAMTNVEEGGVKLYYMGEEYYQDSLKVTIKGQYIELERIQTFLTTIDFSKNSFKGEIPKIIGRLKSLKGLNFSHNNLTGYIPSSFGNLTNLEWLDLSSNKLTGEIPTQLVDLPWLEVLNLSQNQLTGHIPTGKQFNTFGNDSYTGNLGLCGYPLSRTCNNHEAKQPPLSTLQQEDNLEPNNGFGWKAVSIGYGCGAIFGMFMGYIMFKIGKPKWLVRMVKLEQHIMLRRLKNNAHRRGGRR
uniref:Leucine-rich repeat-containing N-terminal plant-type domain-containing protein n=1 Tax=Fagus sylvatica TaxID=28930 RepID=A0A2N9G3F1_FAGSY